MTEYITKFTNKVIFNKWLTGIKKQWLVNRKKKTPIIINNMKPSIYNWANGITIPSSKVDEDIFLKEASKYINKNCKSNPGQLGEWIVKNKLQQFNNSYCTIMSKTRMECPWLIKQKHIYPDIITSKFIFEIKTLRYYNSIGKRGNQGTAVEKIDGIFRKYSNVYHITKKPIIIVLVADQAFEKSGQLYLNAFNKNDYHENIILKQVVPIYKKNGFHIIGLKDLTLSFLLNCIPTVQ